MFSKWQWLQVWHPSWYHMAYFLDSSLRSGAPSSLFVSVPLPAVHTTVHKDGGGGLGAMSQSWKWWWLKAEPVCNVQGLMQKLFRSRVASGAVTMFEPMYGVSRHMSLFPITLHLQNTYSEIKFLSISRWQQQSTEPWVQWGPLSVRPPGHCIGAHP